MRILFLTGLFLACFNVILGQNEPVSSDYIDTELNSVVNNNGGENNPILLELLEIEVELNIFHAICGEEGGAEIIVINSCTGNPTIEWSTGDVGSMVVGLDPGNYEVTISDGHECTELVESFTVENSYTFDVNIATEGNICSGPVTLIAELDGGNALNAEYSWNTLPPLTTQSIIVDTEGSYTVSVDYGTCSASDQITIEFFDFEYNVIYTDFFCDGESGSAGISVQAGQGPFIYEWSTGAISPGISITLPGQYFVTVTDTHTGCGYSQNFFVETYPAISTSISKSDVTCYGFADGEATAVVQGGTPNYEFLWSGGLTTQTISNLIPGNYAVTVTDDNGCTASAVTTITSPTEFSYNISASQGICQGESASFSVTASGGVEPYTYVWSDSPIDHPDRTVSPNQTQTYTVTVYDANGCTQPPKSTTVTVSQTMFMSIDKTEILCHAECNGAAELSFSGGIAPYFFSWSEEDSIFWNTNNPITSGLCAGEYTVTITDLYNCEVSAEFVLEEPQILTATTYTGSPTCFGYTDGYVYVEAFGGTPYTDTLGDNFYQYNWSSSGSSADSIAIGGGHHTVTITDANGCNISKQFFISQPEEIWVTNPSNGNICIGQTHSTTAVATGGTIATNSSYNFTWTSFPDFVSYGPQLQVSPDTTRVYTLVVTDDNGCYGNTRHVTVNVKPPLKLNDIESDLYFICKGDEVTVSIDVEGGNDGPYTYYFNEHTVVNNPYTFKPSETGFYSFKIKDGCGTPYVKDSVRITVHPLPVFSFSANKTRSCPPAEIKFSESTGSQLYSFLWNFGDGKSSLENNPVHKYTSPGQYSVDLTVWSEHGCKNTKSQPNMIRVHPEPAADFTAEPSTTSIFEPDVNFVNFTSGGRDFFWDFGDGSNPKWLDIDPTHQYKQVGDFYVKLIAVNVHGCSDTVVRRVRITDEFTFFAPDAFIPNNDGKNDFFYVLGNGIDPETFHFSVYDRTGHRVFQTSTFSPDEPEKMAWDGTRGGSARDGDPILSPGIYVWYSNFKDLTGKPHQKSGTVMLIR